MVSCPICKIPLQTVRQRDGVYYSCDECRGRAATIPQIRRTTGDRFVSKLMRQMRTAAAASTIPCPFCEAPMRSFEITGPALSLNACKPCNAM